MPTKTPTLSFPNKRTTNPYESPTNARKPISHQTGRNRKIIDSTVPWDRYFSYQEGTTLYMYAFIYWLDLYCFLPNTISRSIPISKIIWHIHSVCITARSQFQRFHHYPIHLSFAWPKGSSFCQTQINQRDRSQAHADLAALVQWL